MNQKTSKQQVEKNPDVEAAKQNLKNNQNDAIDDTFCHELFEPGSFNEKLLQELILDMKLVAADSRNTHQSKSMKWIILNTMRCFTSHFNKNDLYKIKNLNGEIYSK
ncbi:hypothetical protein [Paracidovorax oryzae]|uniref:hypothetical protein n=1 Tax=Paracidovorax oryzae TaxID=862720 RepID=UPI0035D04E3C